MTSHLQIQSPFEDISQLVEGLAPFYDGTYFVVRHGSEVADGEWVRFEIALTDGSVALAGLGKNAGVRDNGEEYGDERFDIYLAEVQVDEGMPEAVWERIVMTSQASGERPTGEVDIAELEAATAATGGAASYEDEEAAAAPAEDAADTTAAHTAYADDAAAHADPEASADAVGYAEEALYDASEATVAVRLPDVPAEALRSSPPPAPAAAAKPAAPPPAPPPGPPAAATAAGRAPGAAPAPRAAGPGPGGPPPAPGPPRVDGLLRPSMPASWSPEAEPPEPRPASEWFAYGDQGLPVPAAPPRPEGDVPRVQPAPRPDTATAAET
jgi:hypothetical protein